MENTEYEYTQDDVSGGFNRSNTSLSNEGNLMHGMPFHDLETFQQNVQNSETTSQLVTSPQYEQQVDPEFYQQQYENEGEDIYQSNEEDQDQDYVGTDDYENILTSMRERVKQMKHKLKPQDITKQYNSMPLSARSSNTNISRLNKSSNVMQLSRIEREESKNQHYMSGFLKSPNAEVSGMCAANPTSQHNYWTVQEAINEEGDVEEMMQTIDMLTRENKALKESNR